MELDSVALAAGIGAALSFILATFPFIAPKWEAFERKREAMLVVFLLAPFAIAGLSCGNVYFTEYACESGAFTSLAFYVENLILGGAAFAASQWAFVNGARFLQKK